MCGISGIIKKNNQTIDVAQLKEVNDLIAHRGPDGEGFYFGSNFAFGHRRLAIIDLTENGHQPMIYAENLVITFNGEIYNYIEVKKELVDLNYKFRSDSDTEVILAAYHCWGEQCVNRFNGMWAFAIYDKIKNVIFCSRDRFGVKPFYFSADQDQFVFGSEIKQILHLQKCVLLNQKIALDYLITGLEEHTNQTFFENVLKLPASHNLVYNLTNHQYSIQRYYKIEYHQKVNSLDEEGAVKTYTNQFNRSINLRLRSDVKVGTCLSGGLDSSSVAVIAGEQYKTSSGQKFIAIHARSTEKQTDESSLAKQVADFCDLDLHIVEPSSEDFIQNLDELIYTQEEPFGGTSVFMQYFVLKKARALNCIVMLDGQGGDETLLGYEKYYPAYLMDLKGIKKWSGFMNASRNSKLSRTQVLSYFFYFTKYKIRLRRLKKRSGYIRSVYLHNFECAEMKQMSEAYLDIKKLQFLEIEKTQLPHLLKYEDKNSMRHSVETRLPFLDYNVLETALSIKNEYKIKNGWTKYVLRKAVEKLLPASIVWRKNKLGFNSPEKTWTLQLDKQIESEIKDSEILNKLVDFSKLDLTKMDFRSKWRLFNLARWEKIYNVKFN